MQRGDVGMHQAGVDLDLAAEALRQVGGLAQIGQQHLHGFQAVGDEIADFVDRAHAAGAEALHHLIVADALANLVSHREFSIPEAKGGAKAR